MLVPVILTGLIAGTLSVSEIFIARRKAISKRAIGFVIALFGVDGGSAMVIYPVVTGTFKGLTWFTGAWPVLLCGLCGPVLLRSQLSLLGSGQEEGLYGPAVRFRDFQKRLLKSIDEEGATEQSDWVNTKVLPLIKRINILDLRSRCESFIKALDYISDDHREAMLDHVRRTLDDSRIAEQDRRHAIVQYMLDGGYRRFVKGLVRRAKKAP